MWPKLLPAAALLLYWQGVLAEECPFTVSVLDVPGVQCVPSAPCSGTYYASGLSQGVGACPTGTSCALLPLTPIMGCAQAGRTDLTYVNADGTLTKDGRTVTLSGDSSKTSDASKSSSTSSKSSAGSSTSSKSSTGSSTSSKSSANSSTGSNSGGSSSTKSSNAASGSGSAPSSADGNSTSSGSLASSSNSSKTNSWESESGSGSNVISPGSSSANQQTEFNPGSILSDGSKTSSTNSGGGLGLASIMGIVVGCLAVVAIAAGMRLLKKGKEAELATPENGGVADGAAVEGYGGGGGMTPKENVLLL